MKYRCSECRREIGPMLDKQGKPVAFRCPHAGRVANAQRVEYGDSP